MKTDCGVEDCDSHRRADRHCRYMCPRGTAFLGELCQERDGPLGCLARASEAAGPDLSGHAEWSEYEIVTARGNQGSGHSNASGSRAPLIVRSANMSYAAASLHSEDVVSGAPVCTHECVHCRRGNGAAINRWLGAGSGRYLLLV